MHKARTRLLPALFAAASLSLSASATDIPPGDVAVPVGFVSYDVTGTNVAQFDIVNLTGANSSSAGDSSFPVITPVSFSNLSLTVDYAGGGSQTFGSSYFTLDGDGFSFDGDQLSTLSGPPTGLFGAMDATLTGTFSTTTIMLNDGSVRQIVAPGFSAFISDPSGLQDGDLAVINAAATPEPSAWLLMGTGLISLLGIAGVRKFKRRHAGYVLGVGCVLLLLPDASQASSAVKLSTATSPASGTAGTGSVSVTGSGFPTGTITPATTNVSLASTCGGTATVATVSSVTKVIGTEDRITFVIPGSLSAGNYFVSISGTSTSGSFSSSNCSSLQVLPGTSPVLTIDTTNPVDWIINNGAMTIDYNSTSGAIWSIVPKGTQDQLIDFSPGNASIHGTVYDPADGESAIGGTTIPAGWNGPSGIPGLPASFANKEPKGFYMDLSGFTTGTAVPTYTLTPTYLDFAVTYPNSATNNTEYEEHFVVTPNDPGIHLYFSLNHPATQPDGVTTNGPGTIGGQVQWIWRGNVNVFTNFYQKLADLSMVTGVKTPLPSTDDCFSSDNGRNVQDATGRDTIALYPQIGVENAFSPYPDPDSGIPQGFHRHYCVKYDYSAYEYIHDAHGLFGSKYGQWVVFTPGHDTFIDGPTKENLALTGNILTIEPESNHYRTGGVGTTSIGAGVALSRIYGPFYVRINQIGMATQSSIDGGIIQNSDDMFNDALAAGSSFTNFYNNEATLISKGYVPTTQRGSVAVQVTGVGSAPRTAWAVLSQPGVNHENSTMSYQYTMDISANGTGTFNNVVPGTYRLSVFDFVQWGEYRNDSIVVAAGHATTVPSFTFQPENFGTVVGTIGTPDRSSHEFLHGAYTQDYPDGPKGYDDRETYMAWNYWADWANSPSPGAPVYYLTDGPGYTATNNPLKWNYAHWGAFDPAIYTGACPGGDDTTTGYQLTGCTSLGDTLGIPAYVSSLPGASGVNGVTTPTPAWQIHFTTPNNPSSGYVVLSHALASSQKGQTVILNSQTALTYSGGSSHFSDAVERSGLSGYTEWIAYQWPISALNAAGTDNVITIKITGANSENSDDAFRLEFSATGASPAVTGWHDYSFVTSVGSSSSTTAVNDAVPNP
jgi:rhamnogalacturonan endolyase